MALGKRQLALYTVRVDLYEPKGQTITGGKAVYSYGPDPSHTDVACYVFEKPSLSADTDFGSIERDIFGTLDVWHFDAEQDIDDAWYIVIKSGMPSEYIGKAWKTRGNPVRHQQGGRRRGDHTEIMAAFHDHPEQGIPGA